MSTWLYQGRVNGEFCLMGVTDVDRTEAVADVIGRLFKPNDWSTGRVRIEDGSLKSFEMEGDHYGDHFVITAERTA
jgi:hypothetical protein